MNKFNLSRIKEISDRYKKHQITVFSAQMAYFLFLAIFPFIVFVMSLASRLNLDIDSFIHDIQSGLPGDAKQMIDDLIRNYLVNDSISLLVISGGFTLWSVSRSVNSLMKSFNTAYGVEESRGFIKIRLTGIVATLVMIILIIVSLALPPLRTVLSILVYVVIILLIHKILPDRKSVV